MKKEIKELVTYIPAPKENINLAMNENHHVQWQEVLAEQWSEVYNDYHYANYGDSHYTELVNAYAKYCAVHADNLLVGHGSDPLIGLLMHALVHTKILLVDPDFFRFEEFAALQKIEVSHISIADGFNVEEIIAKIHVEKVEAFLFSAPNNPLGITASRAEIIKILDNTDCYVIVDEAYMEFAGTSVVDLIDTYPQLLILRTMSKGWGLAGLRVGFVVSQKANIIELKKAIGPFNISALVTRTAALVMQHESYMHEKVAEIIALREKWVQKFQVKYQFKVYPSSTNFINIQSSDAFAIWEFLKKHQINVSKFLPENLRISIGTAAELDKFEEILDLFYQKR